VVATRQYILRVFLGLLVIVFSNISIAAVLPEERADALYHSYDGGGVTIDGPSVLLRKTIADDKISIYGNYYVDMVTSASIDVIRSGPSEYTEERAEYSIGVDYLNDRSLLSFSYTNSTESDYIADTFGFSISQEFFGDLSTITLGFVLGDDTVKRNGDPTFLESVDRKRFSVGLSQIVSKKFLASFSYESVIDEGFLNNPYRQARLDNGMNGFFERDEQYPNTRNSDAYALRGIYSLTPASSIRAEYRKYDDSWGVKSDNFELRYAFEYKRKWLFELRARQYQQDQASFYYDLVPLALVNNVDFFARDKELSNYSSQQYGIGITYKFSSAGSQFLDNSELSFYWDKLTFDYDNFRDVTAIGFNAGEEPLYSLEADVLRIFFSSRF